jgi:hypothetical protein
MNDTEQAVTALTLMRPIAQPADLLAFQDEVHEIIIKTLKPTVDYGIIPGTGTKPTLFKAGAERLNLAFGATPEYYIEEREVDHDREVRWTKRGKIWRNAFKGDREFRWDMVDGMSIGLYRYVMKCRLVRSGRPLAEGIAVCSTLESKYIDRPRDCENTVAKISAKRAYVGATLNAYALSDRFSVDVDDLADNTAASVVPDIAEEPDAGVIYIPTTAQKNQLASKFKELSVADTFWKEISTRLTGRPIAEAEQVIKNVTEGK